MKLVRTNKKISLANVDENFVRQAAAIAGRQSNLLSKDYSKFTIVERFIGTNAVGGTCYPYDEDDKDFVKTADGIEISIDGFDCDIVIWNNAQMQGYYKHTGRNQYAPKLLEAASLMLAYGFFQVVQDVDDASITCKFAEWADNNYFRLGNTSEWSDELDYSSGIRYTTQELFDIFLLELRNNESIK